MPHTAHSHAHISSHSSVRSGGRVHMAAEVTPAACAVVRGGQALQWRAASHQLSAIGLALRLFSELVDPADAGQSDHFLSCYKIRLHLCKLLSGCYYCKIRCCAAHLGGRLERDGQAVEPLRYLRSAATRWPRAKPEGPCWSRDGGAARSGASGSGCGDEFRYGVACQIQRVNGGLVSEGRRCAHKLNKFQELDS
jgi:hypothetical protein